MAENESLVFGAFARRALLAGIGGAGLAASLGLSLSPTPSLAQAQVQPRTGGIMNFNLTADPPNFDPIGNTSSTVLGVLAPCYNGLLRYDPLDSAKIVSDLAESWDVSADGRIYTFKLVRTARFHDGKPFTAADVKFTYDLIRSPPDGTISARKGSLAGVEQIDVVDDYTVRITLKRPTPSFIATIASGWMLILPKHVYEAKGHMRDVIVGTGPFMLKTYARGVSIELAKNPNYHVAGRPYLDGLKGFVIPDPGTTWNYLQNGQLQIMVSIQGQEAGVYKTGGNVTVLENFSTSLIAAVFNTTSAPFDNPKVRLAASLAIDREAALKVAQNGQGVLGGANLPGSWALPTAELEKIPGYGRNVDANRAEAKKLLAEAGYPNGISIKLLVRKIALFEAVGVVLKDQWAKVGINATLDIQENASYFSSVAKRQFQADATGASYQIEDPDSIFGDYYSCKGNANAAGTCNPRLDALFDQQSGTLDVAERYKLVSELEKVALNEYGIFTMYWRNRYMGISNRLKGMTLHPNIDQNMRMEGVWLDR